MHELLREGPTTCIPWRFTNSSRNELILPKRSPQLASVLHPSRNTNNKFKTHALLTIPQVDGNRVPVCGTLYRRRHHGPRRRREIRRKFKNRPKKLRCFVVQSITPEVLVEEEAKGQISSSNNSNKRGPLLK